MLHATEPSPAIARCPGPPAHAIPPWSPLTPEHFFRHACAQNSPCSHLSLAAGFIWEGRDGAVDTCQRARTTRVSREEELRAALGTMTGQENEREEVFDELRDRRVEKC